MILIVRIVLEKLLIIENDINSLLLLIEKRRGCGVVKQNKEIQYRYWKIVMESKKFHLLFMFVSSIFFMTYKSKEKQKIVNNY